MPTIGNSYQHSYVTRRWHNTNDAGNHKQGSSIRARMHQRQLVSQVDVTQYIEITPSISI